MAVENGMRLRAKLARECGAQVLVGLVGTGIQRSLSPDMHMAEAKAQGLQLDYQLIDVDGADATPQTLDSVLKCARELGFSGLNITYPFKQLVFPLLDGLADSARSMGAANTVVFEHKTQKAVGHNTDGSGWRMGFERDLPNADLTRVVLLGAGGAGSAIAHSLCAMGCGSLVLVDADASRAQALKQQLERRACATAVTVEADAECALVGASGLVHATPTGMDKLPGMPMSGKLLHSGLWVSEVVYFPLDTALLRAARALGCKSSDGGGMAVGQALGAFALFTGLQANQQRVRMHFESLVKAAR